MLALALLHDQNQVGVAAPLHAELAGRYCEQTKPATAATSRAVGSILLPARAATPAEFTCWPVSRPHRIPSHTAKIDSNIVIDRQGAKHALPERQHPLKEQIADRSHLLPDHPQYVHIGAV